MTRPFTTVPLRWLFALALFTITIACYGLHGNPPSIAVREPIVLHGLTMGTTYSIRYRPEVGSPTPREIQGLIDNELEIVNQQMSTYRGDSEITRFNDSRSTDWFPVSMETARVVDLAQQIAETSGGAFDITVGPLVNLWGFGPDGGHQSIPSQSQVDAARTICGYENLRVRLKPPALKKKISELRVDLSAIAKGHGSDRLSKLISSKGIQHLFVEIGGEIATQGYRNGDSPWRIGIETPNADQRSIQTTIELSGESLATSGDYRNFFENSNVRYSHTIDPKTGRPVTHQLASASVVDDNCALADAVATCMMVLGPIEGLKLAESENWAVLFLHHHGDSIVSTCTAEFQQRFPEVVIQLGPKRVSEP